MTTTSSIVRPRNLLTTRWHFTFRRRITEQLRARLKAVPGVWSCADESVKAPWDAGWLVEEKLQAAGGKLGQDYFVRGPRPPAKTADVVAFLGEVLGKSPELQPQVWLDIAKPFQRLAVGFTFARGGGNVWIDPGGGKTLTALLWSLAIRADAPSAGPLVVVTRGGARDHWNREARRWTTLRPYVCRAKARQKKRDGDLGTYLAWCATERQRPLVIAAWESLPAWTYGEGIAGEVVDGPLAELLRRSPDGTIVYDESHYGSAHKRAEYWEDDEGELQHEDLQNVSAAAERLSLAAHWRLNTTATAITDRVRGLWGQCSLVAPKAMGGYWPWAKQYCNAHQVEGGWMDDRGVSNLDELKKRLSFFTIRIPYSVSHGSLPPKRRQVRYVLPSEQVRAEGGFLKEAKQALKSGDRDLFFETKLAEAASRKREAVKQLVREYLPLRGGHGKIVIFTARRKVCERLGEAVEHAAKLAHVGEVKTWITHGSTHSDGERFQIAEDFLAHPGPCVLVTTHQAMGQSVDLQDADLAVLAMLPLNPGMLRQVEDRVHRIGQQRPVDIVYLIAEGTVDEHVAYLILDKLPAVEKIAGDEQLRDARVELEGLGDEEALREELFKRMQVRFAPGAEAEAETGSGQSSEVEGSGAPGTKGSDEDPEDLT